MVLSNKMKDCVFLIVFKMILSCLVWNPHKGVWWKKFSGICSYIRGIKLHYLSNDDLFSLIFLSYHWLCRDSCIKFRGFSVENWRFLSCIRMCTWIQVWLSPKIWTSIPIIYSNINFKILLFFMLKKKKMLEREKILIFIT